jgi:uncharacterized protein YcfL
MIELECNGGWKRAIQVSLLLYAFSSIGCGASRPKPRDYSKVLDESKVVMLDTWATTQLALQETWTETKNGFMVAHMTLRNKGGRTLKLEIRTYFKDSRGAPIKTPMDMWDPVTVNPHEDFHYSKMCPNRNGEDYQFHIRMAKESHE